MIRITATLTAQIGEVYTLTEQTGEEYSMESDAAYVREAEEYEGAYEFTPTDQIQTIPVAGQTPVQDIIINPIPSNYGLITWNGSTLTVS